MFINLGTNPPGIDKPVRIPHNRQVEDPRLEIGKLTGLLAKETNKVKENENQIPPTPENKEIGEVADGINELAPVAGDPETEAHASLADLLISDTSVGEIAPTTRARTIPMKVDAAYRRIAEKIMVDQSGFAAYRGPRGLRVYVNEHWTEETYKFVRIALRDWLIENGQVDAVKSNVVGAFRIAGSFHTTYQRGEKAGESHPYPEQIRITRVK